ncbi:hypothetical protein [Chishuiella sp.]|uniref:hypothetical protein n=1 Tax=Chishuiella sp. TaxID=1969467 RepID=UPI0028AA4293|nr:hypothetical protein [Chishuiella sp.]
METNTTSNYKQPINLVNVNYKLTGQSKLLPFNKYVMRVVQGKGYKENMSSRFRDIINSLQ